MKLTTPEKVIQLQILKYLKLIGATAGKTKTMGTPLVTKRGRGFRFDPYTFIGFPDITGFHKKRIFFIEVKSEKGKLSPAQKEFQKICEESGNLYIVARSVEDVMQFIY